MEPIACEEFQVQRAVKTELLPESFPHPVGSTVCRDVTKVSGSQPLSFWNLLSRGSRL